MNWLFQAFRRDSPESIIRRATTLVEPLFSDLFQVTYEPEFPRADGAKHRWFQIVFVVGPAVDSDCELNVHEYFIKLLNVLNTLPVVRQAEVVAFRARRRCAPYGNPEGPRMFIECFWQGAAIANLLKTGGLANWHSHCDSYVNRFDDRDPLNINRTLPR